MNKVQLKLDYWECLDAFENLLLNLKSLIHNIEITTEKSFFNGKLTGFPAAIIIFYYAMCLAHIDEIGKFYAK
jgi:hypothetical protein